jgi:hypothetical protein
MGQGITKKGNNTTASRTATGLVVVAVELSPNEMQFARVGGEYAVNNASNIKEGDYVNFDFVVDPTTNSMVADKLQLDPTTKGTIINGQSIQDLNINRGESYLITNSVVNGTIKINGGVLVVTESTINKIKDELNASDFTIILMNSTVNGDFKVDSGANTSFVAQGCRFYENIKFTKKDPVILCIANSEINKLVVK